jgi:hypothetical protein
VKQSIATIAAFLALTSVAKGEPEPDYNEIGKLAYALWDCAAFAQLSNSRKEEFERLFHAGHSQMTKFVTAAKEGLLNEENTREVPIGLSWYFVSGPTIEFSLGYMWAQFSSQAFDDTFEESSEMPLEQKELLQMAKAEQGYREKNCALLRE